MVDVTSLLLAQELTFHFSRTAPVHGDGGAQVGTSQVDRDGLVVHDDPGRLGGC